MRVRVAHLLPLLGRDTYDHGHGHMVGTLFDRFTVVDGHGDEFDIGELATYLDDAILFAPSMLLGTATSWRAVDDTSFEVGLTDAGRTVTGRVRLDGAARPTTSAPPPVRRPGRRPRGVRVDVRQHQEDRRGGRRRAAHRNDGGARRGELGDGCPRPGVDLLVVGGPTHAFGMSRPATRADAGHQGADQRAAAGAGLREWVEKVTTGAAHPPVAAFDTKINRPRLPGSAARAARNRLRRAGFPRCTARGELLRPRHAGAAGRRRARPCPRLGRARGHGVRTASRGPSRSICPVR